MKKEILLTIAAVAALSVSARGPVSDAGALKALATQNQPELSVSENSSLYKAEKAECVGDASLLKSSTRAITYSGGDTIFYRNLQPFYVGYNNTSTGISTFYAEVALVPAWSTLYFYNVSKTASSDEVFTWTYPNVNDPQYDTSGSLTGYGTTTKNGKHLILTDGLPGNVGYSAPTLATSNGSYTPVGSTSNGTTYGSYIYSGGGFESWGFTTSARNAYAFPYSIQQCDYTYYFNNVSVGDTLAFDCTSFVKKYYDSSITKASYNGIGQIFSSTTAPYYFDKVFALGVPVDSLVEGTVLKGTIYEYKSSTNMTKIGQMSYTFTSTVKTGYWARPEFEVETVDALTGLTSTGIVVPAGTSIAVVIDDFGGTAGFMPRYGLYSTASYPFHDYTMLWHYVSDKGSGFAQPLLGTGSAYVTHLALGINAEFDFVHFDTTNVTLPLEGGSVSLDGKTLYSYKGWEVEEDEDGTGVIDGWLKYSVAAGSGTNGNWEPVLTLSAEKATETRKATMTIYGYVCAETVLTVTQGTDAGVDAVVTEAIKVKKSGENFEVVVPETVSGVQVYNLNGQLVVTQALGTGVNTVEASSLAAGVYVLKFNNGTTVKAVK